MKESQWLEKTNGYAFSGEITRENVPELWATLKRWKPTQPFVDVSLQATSRIDSAGMVMLIHLIEHAKNKNCHIMLSFVPEQLMTLFQLSNIEIMLLDHIEK